MEENNINDKVIEGVANTIHTGIGCFGCLMYSPFIIAIIVVLLVGIIALFS